MFSTSALLWFVWLLLALAAAAEADLRILHKQPEHEPVHISPHIYQKFQVYANYTSASYRHEGECRHPPYDSVIVEYISVKSTGTQAVIFRNDHSREYVLAFPGTTSDKDRHTDKQARLERLRTRGISRKKCRKCRVHKGVQEAWNSIVNDTTKALNRDYQKHHSYALIISGHSLGATLASLSTASLKGLGFRVKETVTFGQPRVGNRHYADYIDRITGASEKHAGSFYRVTHTNDAVPHHPARSLGYKHHRTEFWELNTKTGGQSAHRTFRCFGQEPRDCNDSTKSRRLITQAHLVYSGIEMEGHKSCEG